MPVPTSTKMERELNANKSSVERLRLIDADEDTPPTQTPASRRQVVYALWFWYFLSLALRITQSSISNVLCGLVVA